MAVYIDVITGFLESGKTTFIKDIIEKNCLMEYQKSVLIVCEEGYTEYQEDMLTKHRVDIISVEEESELNENFFENIKKQYMPEHIIMEFNGTWNISELLMLKLPFSYQIRNVIFISDADKFSFYLGNMSFIMQPHILNSDIVVFNRYESLKIKQKNDLKQTIRNINKRTEVMFMDQRQEGFLISRYFAPYEKYIKINNSTKVFILILVCLLILPNFTLYRLYRMVQSMSTIFLSILIEAVPFVLLGAFISSAIQIFIPSEWLMKHFSGKKFGSFAVASIAGFFMPICDCGTVPVVTGLLKKDTPFPQTITFWLASSAVNPVVLISVYYAFPDRPYLVLVRLFSGIIIAIFIGIIFGISKTETKVAVKRLEGIKNVGADILELKYEGSLGKAEAVIKGARIEFFRVLKYLIFGALVSSFLQTVIPQAVTGSLNNKIELQLFTMIIAAIFMSTCSTSNPFIGRSFLKSFTIMPVMSYIVLGPMLDFKNMMMLSEIMKTKYLIILALLVSISGYLLFYLMALYL